MSTAFHQCRYILLYFGFTKFNVFFGNRVIFPLCHFLGHCAAVFLCNIEKAGICRRQKLDFNCRRFSHSYPYPVITLSWRPMTEAAEGNFGATVQIGAKKSRAYCLHDQPKHNQNDI